MHGMERDGRRADGRTYVRGGKTKENAWGRGSMHACVELETEIVVVALSAWNIACWFPCGPAASRSVVQTK
jgi:hypothetical protein